MKASVFAAVAIAASLVAAPAFAQSLSGFGGLGVIGGVGGLTGSTSGADTWTKTGVWGNGTASAGTESTGFAKSGVSAGLGTTGTPNGIYGQAYSGSASTATTSSTGNGASHAATGGSGFGATGSVGALGVLGGGFISAGPTLGPSL